MLARKYDNYAWEEEEQYAEALYAERQAAQVGAMADSSCRQQRTFIYTLVAMALFTYFFSVIRSEACVDYGNELLSLKLQETQLINKNNELKIEVERLKGPERIIGIAEKQLGMSVARSNIYVKAAGVKNNAAAYALATK